MKVAVAVITDANAHVLITRRSPHAPHGGMLWEFPGGKLELDETPEAALIREVKEEIGLDVIQYNFLGEVNHAYNKHSVSLLVYHVSDFRGEAHCCETQMDLRWVAFENIQDFEFPAANSQIIALYSAVYLKQLETE